MLEDSRRPRLKVNWKTHIPAFPRYLSPESARQSHHHAEDTTTYVDYYADADRLSRSGLISNKAHRLYEIDVHPKEFLVSKPDGESQFAERDGFFDQSGGSGMDSGRRRRLSSLKSGVIHELSGGSEIEGGTRSQSGSRVWNEPSGGSEMTGGVAQNLSTFNVNLLGAKSILSTLEQSLPVLNRQLMSGDQLELLEAVITILQVVQGDNERAAEARVSLGAHLGILPNLIRALKICSKNYQHVIYQTLGQTAFNNPKNALQILHDQDIYQQVYEAAHSAAQDLELEVARMLNNLAASGVDASSRIVHSSKMLDALKRLCQSPSFAVRSRSVGTFHVLSRHPSLVNPLVKADVVSDTLSVVSKSGGTKEEHQMFCLTLTCAQGNLMGTIERKTWTADPEVMATAVQVLRAALEGRVFAGVSCPLTPVLRSLKSLAVSKSNQTALVNCEVIPELVDYLEGWAEDMERNLSDQLTSLELALGSVLALLPAAGCKLKLHSHGFGPCLFNICRTKPSQNAVGLANKLIELLHLVEEEDSHGFNHGGRSMPAPDAARSPVGHRSPLHTFKPKAKVPHSMPIGLSPMGSFEDSFSPMVRAGSAGWSNRLIEITDDPRRRFGSQEVAPSLKWNMPATRACVRLIQTKVAEGWERMVAALRGADGREGRGLVRGEVYQMLGQHRVWLEGEEWEELLEGSGGAGGGVDTGWIAEGFQEALWGAAGGRRRARSASAGRGGGKGEGGGIAPWGGRKGVARELVERVLQKQMEADFEGVRRVLAAERSADGVCAMQVLKEVMERVGWSLSKGEWERLRQTLDAGGAGQLRVSEYLQIHAAAVGRGQGREQGAGEAVQAVAQVLRGGGTSVEKAGLAEAEQVVGGFHEAARLEPVRVRAVRDRTSRLERDSRPLTPLARKKNAFLAHRAPPMAVHDDGEARVAGGGRFAAKEAVNSFAAVQGYVPRGLRGQVGARRPAHAPLLDSARNALPATSYQLFAACPTLVPYRSAPRPLGHG